MALLAYYADSPTTHHRVCTTMDGASIYKDGPGPLVSGAPLPVHSPACGEVAAGSGGTGRVRGLFYILSKALQVMGMLTMPWALYLGMVRDDMNSELMLLGLGGVLFLMGRQLERGTESS